MKPLTKWQLRWRAFVRRLELVSAGAIHEFRWARRALGGRWVFLPSIFGGYFWVRERHEASGVQHLFVQEREDWRSDEEKLADMLREEV